MATDTFLGLSGEGFVTLSSATDIALIGVEVTSLGDLTTVRSTVSPRRIYQLGSITLAFTDNAEWGTGSLLFASETIHIDREAFAYWPKLPIGRFAGIVLYDLEPGAVINLYVNHP